LSRGGDRQANRALHTIAMSRMRWDQRTRDFIAGIQARGKSKRDAIRILKRYLARRIYRILTTSRADSGVAPSTLTPSLPIG